MLGFLNRKIPTLVGIIIILSIAGAAGAMIFWQLHQITQIHLEVISSLPE